MIEKLTKKQEDAMNDYLEKWMKVGLSTDLADRNKAESAIERMYAYQGKVKPIIKWYNNPNELLLNAAKASIYYDSQLRNPKIDLSSRESKINLIEQVLSKGVKEKDINKKLKEKAKELFEFTIEREFIKSDDFLKDKFFLGLVSFYDFFRNELGLIKETESIEFIIDLAESAGMVLPLDTHCFVSERCCLINESEIRFRSSPLFPDGYKIKRSSN